MIAEPLRTIGAATEGTAGGMFGRPFKGAAEDFPFWAMGAEEPTTTGGWAPVSGVDVGFLFAPAAEAYDVAAEAWEDCAGIGFC